MTDEVKNLVSFTYNFSQDVRPLYGMIGLSEANAQKCYKVIIGLPEITFTETIFAADANSQSMETHAGYTGATIRSDTNCSTILKYKTTQLVKYTGVILDDISTSFADAGGGNMYDLSYSVIGAYT